MFKTLAAAVMAIGLASAAQAAPPTQKSFGIDASQSSGVTLVRDRDRDRRRHWRHRHHRGHWHGRRHWRHGPPRGWRRYSARPWNYRARGCVMFGPVWFCP
jgi:Ni/Co efflux regulator RcnB